MGEGGPSEAETEAVKVNEVDKPDEVTLASRHLIIIESSPKLLVD